MGRRSAGQAGCGAPLRGTARRVRAPEHAPSTVAVAQRSAGVVLKYGIVLRIHYAMID